MSKINSRNSIPSKAEQGQSLVELAISLIVMLTLLAGAVDFGVALYSYVALRDAAQEGALYASAYGSEDGTNLECPAIEDRVRDSSSSPVAFILSDGSDNTDIDISICTVPAGSSPDYECPGSCSVSGAAPCEGDNAMIQVEVSYDYQLTMPILPGVLGISEIPLSASVIDAILQPACDS